MVALRVKREKNSRVPVESVLLLEYEYVYSYATIEYVFPTLEKSPGYLDLVHAAACTSAHEISEQPALIFKGKYLRYSGKRQHFGTIYFRYCIYVKTIVLFKIIACNKRSWRLADSREMWLAKVRRFMSFHFENQLDPFFVCLSDIPSHAVSFFLFNRIVMLCERICQKFKSCTFCLELQPKWWAPAWSRI